ncbi:hypothetical protein Poly21_41330 [Allorhodopirellula heiligendammensis]|uniref:Uncharacterized protein n=1 Tax=Allorhodopirellula heiligendammensis TaxID=2714739 RepID=A0A5C6BY76_9BACT|nr:hypothetical protein Poly21_41330 [Allorhodopirellula heiligendammensis]
MTASESAEFEIKQGFERFDGGNRRYPAKQGAHAKEGSAVENCISSLDRAWLANRRIECLSLAASSMTLRLLRIDLSKYCWELSSLQVADGRIIATCGGGDPAKIAAH